MLLKIIFVLLLVLSFSHSPALAQLGPKDGTDLSPTDLQRIKVGRPAPDFNLEDMNGKKHHSVGLSREENGGFGFYRRFW
jgi:hypothetical protein